MSKKRDELAKQFCKKQKLEAIQLDSNDGYTVRELHIINESLGFGFKAGYDAGMAVKDEQVKELLKALDIAIDLLPVAEHNQDQEWYEQEKKVNEVFAKYKHLRRANESI